LFVDELVGGLHLLMEKLGVGRMGDGGEGEGEEYEGGMRRAWASGFWVLQGAEKEHTVTSL
jgi:hypothetical protein